MACPLAAERIWFEKSRYHDAEREYYERLAKLLKGTVSTIEPIVEESPPVQPTQSPPEEVMIETTEVVEKVSATKLKKKKKLKVVKSEEPSSERKNHLSKDVSPTSASEVITVDAELLDLKTKKKKKKKSNKDVVPEKQTEEQENISPNQTLIETKTELQDSNKKSKNLKNKGPCTLVSEIAKARQHIKNSLEKMDGIATLAATPASPDIVDRLAAVEKDNVELRQLIEGLKKVCIQSENRVKSLEQKLTSLSVSCGGEKPIL